MNVLVWGLGYVGTVTAACLAEMGHRVIGVDPNRSKLDALRSGRCAVKEPGLENLVRATVESGALTVAEQGTEAVADCELSLICVGTPSAADGAPVLDYLKGVATDIAAGLSRSRRDHVVVIRSTASPGTARNTVLPILERLSNRRLGHGLGLAVNPEFLRETSAIKDFLSPPYTVIGEFDQLSGDRVVELYSSLSAPVHRVSPETAEMLKLVCNAFHAMKVGFANEVSRFCDRLDVDARTVMELVCADTKLNISPLYLKPGFAFGGSCLPKDLRSLLYQAVRLGAELPILEGVLRSNQVHIDWVRVRVHEIGAERVAILGLSFKAGTDDLRESPVLHLIRQLWQDGIDVLVHDPDVVPEEMLGANREYLERQLPQIRKILRPRLEDALRDRDLVVITQERPAFRAALEARELPAVMDLTTSASRFLHSMASR